MQDVLGTPWRMRWWALAYAVFVGGFATYLYFWFVFAARGASVGGPMTYGLALIVALPASIVLFPFGSDLYDVPELLLALTWVQAVVLFLICLGFDRDRAEPSDPDAQRRR